MSFYWASFVVTDCDRWVWHRVATGGQWSGGVWAGGVRAGGVQAGGVRAGGVRAGGVGAGVQNGVGGEGGNPSCRGLEKPALKDQFGN